MLVKQGLESGNVVGVGRGDLRVGGLAGRGAGRLERGAEDEVGALERRSGEVNGDQGRSGEVRGYCRLEAAPKTRSVRDQGRSDEGGSMGRSVEVVTWRLGTKPRAPR